MHVVVVVQAILVLEFRKSDLITTVVIFHFLQIILASSHHIDGIVVISRIRH